ncbi:hypothetical protein DWUX_249 [Desulfovibrio diazotrophicus]|nr:hypothetical protein DWUX_249 [Desulfovibrio diazotrophicus]
MPTNVRLCHNRTTARRGPPNCRPRRVPAGGQAARRVAEQACMGRGTRLVGGHESGPAGPACGKGGLWPSAPAAPPPPADVHCESIAQR